MHKVRPVAHLILGAFFGCVLSGCAITHPLRAADASAPPRFIELRAGASAATLHFPRGLYSLDAVDDKGYYYRAPQKIVQHSWSGSLPHEGGLFISKRDRRKMRGYVILPGGLTHVGNFSSVAHEFRN